MRSALGLLLVCSLLAACGSETEKTVRAPRPTPAAPAAQDCRSAIAVGTRGGATLTKHARKALRRLRAALKSDDATVLCASDVDYIGEHQGWTPYAPLPGRTRAP
jgi:hypothetical protein